MIESGSNTLPRMDKTHHTAPLSQNQGQTSDSSHYERLRYDPKDVNFHKTAVEDDSKKRLPKGNSAQNMQNFTSGQNTQKSGGQNFTSGQNVQNFTGGQNYGAESHRGSDLPRTEVPSLSQSMHGSIGGGGASQGLSLSLHSPPEVPPRPDKLLTKDLNSGPPTVPPRPDRSSSFVDSPSQARKSHRPYPVSHSMDFGSLQRNSNTGGGGELRRTATDSVISKSSSGSASASAIIAATTAAGAGAAASNSSFR